jgi:cytochrome c biogenesis protein CcdA
VSVLGPFALAFAAGLVSFTSPCCLPLIPGYVRRGPRDRVDALHRPDPRCHLTAAATVEGVWRGADLLLVYSLELLIPFLLPPV